MRLSIGHAVALAGLLATGMMGCSSGPAPETSAPPPATALPPPRIVSGAEDSVGALPGSPGAQHRYRFRQIDPSSDQFTFRDRELTFYFRPSPTALYFQVENLQDRPAWIEWERSTFYPPLGTSGKVAHATTRWEDRYAVQPATQIAGLQRYSDYLLPLDYLLDPAGSSEQLHRSLFPEDGTAPQFTNAEFGVDLVFRMDEKLITYPFRFRVVSVTAR